MKFLPYQHFYLGTRLTYSELNRRLQMLTDTSFHWLEPFSSRKKYFGQITRNGFRIHHWININGYRNPDVDPGALTTFSPVIAGDFLDAANGEIIIRMRLHPHWTAPLGLLHWLLIYGFIFVLPFIIFMTEVPSARLYPEYGLSMLVALIILVFLCSYATMIAFFERHARREKEYFLDITEAYEVMEKY